MALTKNARHGARQHSVGVVQPCDAADNRAHNTDHDACHTPCNIKTALQRIQPVVGVQHTTGCGAGHAMLPISWHEMQCPVTHIKEERKVALTDHVAENDSGLSAGALAR